MKASSQLLKSINNHWGLLLFVGYFIASSVYCLERTLFLDNAFQTFLMISDGRIEINANRWPAIIVRFLPFVFIKLHLPLKAVLWAFSISYVLFHFILFSIVNYVLLDKKAAVLLLATITLPVVHGFFWCNSELVLGLSLLVLWTALVSSQKQKMSLCMLPVLVWIHPLVLFPFAFLILYYLKTSSDNRRFLLFSSAVYFLLYWVKDHYFLSWYDGIKKAAFNKNLAEYDFGDFGFFELILNTPHWIPIVVLVLAIMLTLYKKLWFEAFSTLLFSIVYLTVLDISTGPQESSFEFYTEINFYVIFFISCFMLIQNFNYKTSVGLRYILILSCFFIPLVNWISVSAFYADRIDWYNSILELGDRKIYNSADFKDAPLVMSWASAFETLLISSINGKSQSILIHHNPDKYRDSLSFDILLTEYKSYPIDSLDTYYFNLEKKSYLNGYLD
jgi:hypothetical protein